jgi:deferrochelatase/peroxidase EfeB
MAGAAAGLTYAGGAASAAASPPSGSPAPQSEQKPVPFRGEHQAGIVTPAQDRMHFVALDVITQDAAELTQLQHVWTRAAEL